MKILGAVMIVVGVLVVLYGGLSIAYNSQDPVVDAGPIHVDVTKHHYVFVPPLIGALVILGGVAALAAQGQKG
jgi:drug/metabolite transporter (DMT)-like permease